MSRPTKNAKSSTKKATRRKTTTKKAITKRVAAKKSVKRATTNTTNKKSANKTNTIVNKLGTAIKSNSECLLVSELAEMKSKKELIEILDRKKDKRVDKIIRTLKYEEELQELQIELIKLQQWAKKEGKRIAILFEGRDAAGKGGAIRRFIEHLNPREMRVVALPKPTETELGQWYFQRYVNQLPNPGEIVFFDRSWYNRAVVEPVNNFCTQKQYEQFLTQVPEFEHMLYEDGVIIIKFWFSISKDEQLKRFESRRQNPLKQWKISPVDMKAQKLWNKYTHYKGEMFGRTHTSYCPWIIVRANSKKKARLASIRYVLNKIEYTNKNRRVVRPDPKIVQRYHRSVKSID